MKQQMSDYAKVATMPQPKQHVPQVATAIDPGHVVTKLFKPKNENLIWVPNEKLERSFALKFAGTGLRMRLVGEHPIDDIVIYDKKNPGRLDGKISLSKIADMQRKVDSEAGLVLSPPVALEINGQPHLADGTNRGVLVRNRLFHDRMPLYLITGGCLEDLGRIGLWANSLEGQGLFRGHEVMEIAVREYYRLKDLGVEHALRQAADTHLDGRIHSLRNRIRVKTVIANHVGPDSEYFVYGLGDIASAIKSTTFRELGKLLDPRLSQMILDNIVQVPRTNTRDVMSIVAKVNKFYRSEKDFDKAAAYVDKLFAPLRRRYRVRPSKKSESYINRVDLIAKWLSGVAQRCSSLNDELKTLDVSNEAWDRMAVGLLACEAGFLMLNKLAEERERKSSKVGK